MCAASKMSQLKELGWITTPS